MKTYKRGNDSKTHTVVKKPNFGPRFKDETGKKYGRLTVNKYLGVNHVRHAVWECICECGNIINSSVNSFRQGNKNSCGCITIERIRENASKYQSERVLSVEEIGINSIISHYKFDAKHRNIKFLLTKEQFAKLIKQKCYYCNSDLSNHRDMLLGRIFSYNGIDRTNSNKDYTIDNCVTCCSQCNNAKLDYTKEEFIEWIIKVYNFFIDKKK
jgi:5-methylcytosine-specific restriction endonuclease McrA